RIWGRPKARSRGKNLWGHLLFPDVLECSLEEDSEGYQRGDNHDPATAYSQILVSSDGRTAGHWESPLAAVPSGVERLGSLCCVLCRQGFVGARHAWAVKAHPGPDWALGVSWEFVSQM
ncbi:TRI39 ligase, partial [Pycnonotus jocosus]|nr:TRI39 ligase [Pycnonotus jocosus]